MNIKGYLTIILCFLSTLAFSQEGTSSQITGTGGFDYRIRSGGRMVIRSRLPENPTIDYDAHLFEEPRKASIILLEGDTVEGFYKYNVETESLEEAITDRIIPWNVVKSFTLEASANDGPRSFSNIKLSWPKSEFGGFIQDVSTSPFVKVKHYLEFIPSNYDPTTEIGSMTDEIKMLSTKYLKVKTSWLEIPNTKGGFYNLFGSYSDQLRKYARKNRLKFKNPEDVGKMVDWVVKKRK